MQSSKNTVKVLNEQITLQKYKIKLEINSTTHYQYLTEYLEYLGLSLENVCINKDFF